MKIIRFAKLLEDSCELNKKENKMAKLILS